jgi:hypothetical protein
MHNAPESKPLATILLPLPPDYSCEIIKPITYVDYVADAIADKMQAAKDADETGKITLTINEAEAFCWMLCDAGTVIHHINRDFYGEKSWSDTWWKSRAELETCGIKIPHWFEIEKEKQGVAQ